MSSPFDPPRDENGNVLPVPGSQTDWDRVRHNIATNAHIPYDPEDGPYDPNDDAAVDAYWDEGERLGLVTSGYVKKIPFGEPSR